MKRLVAFILVLSSLLSCIFIAVQLSDRLHKEEESYATNVNVGVHRIVTDKSVYVEGEPILVTAWSPNSTDKVNIAPLSAVVASIRWYYVGWCPDITDSAKIGPGSGLAYDIRQAHLVNNSNVTSWQDIPAGEYILFMHANTGGYNSMYCYTTITVVAAE